MKSDHSLHQSDLPVKLQVLNISVNMARMGELVLKFGDAKAGLVKKFMDQTESYLKDLESSNISNAFRPTLDKFNEEFKKLKREKSEGDLWAERAITWGDILQIRSKFI